MNNITREYFNFCSLFCHLWSLLSFSSVQGSSDSHSFPQKLNQILFCLSFAKGSQQEIFHHRGLLFHPGAVAEPQAQPHWRLSLIELWALDSCKSIAPTPYLQICRWSRSHPPDARTHKLSPLTTMRASVFQTSKYRLYLHCIQCTFRVRLLKLQSLGEYLLNLFLVTPDAGQPADLLLQLLYLATLFSTRAHLLQCRKPSPTAAASARALRLS